MALRRDPKQRLFLEREERQRNAVMLVAATCVVLTIIAIVTVSFSFRTRHVIRQVPIDPAGVCCNVGEARAARLSECNGIFIEGAVVDDTVCPCDCQNYDFFGTSNVGAVSTADTTFPQRRYFYFGAGVLSSISECHPSAVTYTANISALRAQYGDIVSTDRNVPTFPEATVDEVTVDGNLVSFTVVPNVTNTEFFSPVFFFDLPTTSATVENAPVPITQRIVPPVGNGRTCRTSTFTRQVEIEPTAQLCDAVFSVEQLSVTSTTTTYEVQFTETDVTTQVSKTTTVDVSAPVNVTIDAAGNTFFNNAVVQLRYTPDGTPVFVARITFASSIENVPLTVVYRPFTDGPIFCLPKQEFFLSSTPVPTPPPTLSPTPPPTLSPTPPPTLSPTPPPTPVPTDVAAAPAAATAATELSTCSCETYAAGFAEELIIRTCADNLPDTIGLFSVIEEPRPTLAECPPVEFFVSYAYPNLITKLGDLSTVVENASSPMLILDMNVTGMTSVFQDTTTPNTYSTSPSFSYVEMDSTSLGYHYKAGYYVDGNYKEPIVCTHRVGGVPLEALDCDGLCTLDIFNVTLGYSRIGLPNTPTARSLTFLVDTFEGAPTADIIVAASSPFQLSDLAVDNAASTVATPDLRELIVPVDELPINVTVRAIVDPGIASTADVFRLDISRYVDNYIRVPCTSLTVTEGEFPPFTTPTPPTPQPTSDGVCDCPEDLAVQYAFELVCDTPPRGIHGRLTVEVPSDIPEECRSGFQSKFMFPDSVQIDHISLEQNALFSVAYQWGAHAIGVEQFQAYVAGATTVIDVFFVDPVPPGTEATVTEELDGQLLCPEQSVVVSDCPECIDPNRLRFDADATQECSTGLVTLSIDINIMDVPLCNNQVAFMLIGTLEEDLFASGSALFNGAPITFEDMQGFVGGINGFRIDGTGNGNLVVFLEPFSPTAPVPGTDIVLNLNTALQGVDLQATVPIPELCNCCPSSAPTITTSCIGTTGLYEYVIDDSVFASELCDRDTEYLLRFVFPENEILGDSSFLSDRFTLLTGSISRIPENVIRISDDGTPPFTNPYPALWSIPTTTLQPPSSLVFNYSVTLTEPSRLPCGVKTIEFDAPNCATTPAPVPPP